MADTPPRATLRAPVPQHAAVSPSLINEFLDEPVLFIDCAFGSTEFYGTRTQLEVDRLIPGEAPWPEPGQFAGWMDGPWHWTLRRALRKDCRGKRLPITGKADYWRLRRHRMGEALEACEIRLKTRELAEMMFRSTAEGKAYAARESRRWWEAQQDRAFARFMCHVLAFTARSTRHARNFKAHGGGHA